MSTSVLVLDLDDTLYDEMTFVHSGFRAVAAWGEEHLGRDADRSFSQMVSLLEANGRGRVFDDWLSGQGPVREALRTYRRHRPVIELWESAKKLLARHRDSSIYLVTDGHKGVQQRKVDALGLTGSFRGIYLTSRYGRQHAKPSAHCFRLIAERERVPMTSLVHVADNPAKDFVGLNPLGVTTVRVLTGQHSSVIAQPASDAHHRISSLMELPVLLERLGIELKRASPAAHPSGERG